MTSHGRGARGMRAGCASVATRVGAALAAAALLAGVAVSATEEKPAADGAAAPLAWWKTSRAKMESVIARQGRSILDIESPKWYETPYNTVGRMPVIDTCLRQPLVMPEIALWADERAKAVGGDLNALFRLAAELSEETAFPGARCGDPPAEPEWLGAVAKDLAAAPVPAGARDATAILLPALASAAAWREEAFAALSGDERRSLDTLLPGYFVRKTAAGESVVGYTTSTVHCMELIDVLRGVDFEKLFCAAEVLSEAGDEAVRKLASFPAADPAASNPAAGSGALFDRETPIGRIRIGGTGDDTYRDDFALLIDLGGNDLYLNRPAATMPTGLGAAAFFDLSGNDVYRSDGFAQGSAVGGTTCFADLAGDDQYVSGHYSQGAALCGFSFFLEGGGDDTYTAGFGAQSFAMFGYSLFAERGGRDNYRVAAMGQAAASTLGVAILAEAGGDDAYRAGGKYGFYSNYDSSCAQGAASGIRMYPPMGKHTVYGGVGFLSEQGGNDTYDAYIIGQGGSYIFALGMLVDSAGNDTYTSERYCRGVGVHLSAAVALDLAGDDLHNGFYGNNGYSLDRSSGVFVDFDGADTYRTTGGIGFGHKPKGTGIFVDVRGNDTYAGSENNYGRADVPFGDEAFSTGFFLDYGGKDFYPREPYRNNAVWEEGTFGYGEDAEVEKPDGAAAAAWEPTPIPASAPAAVAGETCPPAGSVDRIAGLLHAPLALVRMTGLDQQKAPLADIVDAAARTGAAPAIGARRHLADLVETMLTKETLTPELCRRLAPLLSAEDYDVRILGLNAMRALKLSDAAMVDRAAALSKNDSSDEVRGMACLALGDSGSPRAAAPLLAALKDKVWTVRRRAAIGLGELKDPKTEGALLGALATDDAFQVRGYAARALGRLKRPAAVPALEKALWDDKEFVRALAAQALLLGYSRKLAVEPLITLFDWSNGPLRERWVFNFMTDLTGQALPNEKKPWAAWWIGAAQVFDPKSAGAAYDRLIEARDIKDKGKEAKALPLYRALHKEMPHHAGVSRDLAAILNSLAWEHALSGKEIAQGIRLAEEALAVSSDLGTVDTLAVLYFVGGEREKAEKTVLDAIEKAKDADTTQLKMRLAEIRAGKLTLG